MKEKMVAIIEGLARPFSWAGILVSKYPSCIDRDEELSGITEMRGACPNCQEFRIFRYHQRTKKWRCVKCKKYFAEKAIVNYTIAFVFRARQEWKYSEPFLYAYCRHCEKNTVFNQISEDKFECSQCKVIISAKEAYAGRWNFANIPYFT